MLSIVMQTAQMHRSVETYEELKRRESGIKSYRKEGVYINSDMHGVEKETN